MRDVRTVTGLIGAGRCIVSRHVRGRLGRNVVQGNQKWFSHECIEFIAVGYLSYKETHDTFTEQVHIGKRDEMVTTQVFYLVFWSR